MAREKVVPRGIPVFRVERILTRTFTDTREINAKKYVLAIACLVTAKDC